MVALAALRQQSTFADRGAVADMGPRAGRQVPGSSIDKADIRYRPKSAGRPLTAVDPSRSYLDLDVSICFGQKLSSIECAAASRYALEDSAQWPVN